MMETEPEIGTRKPSRMTSMRRWFSLRVTKERTKTDAPEELLAKLGPTPGSAVDEGATAPSLSKPTSVSSKDKATSAEAGKDNRKDSNDDGEEDEPKDPKDDKDADDKGADASRPPRDFRKEAWDSDGLGDTRRALLQGRSGLSKPNLKDQKADQKPSRANAIRLVELVIKDTETKMISYEAHWGSESGESSLGKARSILFSALTVKEVLDSTVQFDPTGYCSAAWAVVSFGLTV